MDQLNNSFWSSPSVISTALFVGSHALWYCSKLLCEHAKHINPYSYDDENSYTDTECEQDWSGYFQKRLEHRLSFPSFQHPSTNGRSSTAEDFESNNRYEGGIFYEEEANDDQDELRETSSKPKSPRSTLSPFSNEFYPKNSNWTHFETWADPKIKSAAKSSTTERQEIAELNELPCQSGPSSQNQRGVNRDFLRMSLEGESAAIFNDEAMTRNLSSISSSSHVQTVSSDEESTDGEDSQASRDHFVWTDAEYRASLNLKKQSQQHQQQQRMSFLERQRSGLPVILSERSVSRSDPTAPSLPGSGATTPALSQANSPAGSVRGDDEEDPKFDSQVTVDRTLCPVSQTNCTTSPATKPASSVQPQNHTNGTRDAIESFLLPKIVPTFLLSKDDNSKPMLPSANGEKLSPRALSAPEPSNQPKTQRSKVQRSSSGTLPNNKVARRRNLVSEHRANYNARIMPHKLILIRHGQSMGNIDETLYSTTPDNAIPLTDLGWQQAQAAGKRLRQIIGESDDVHFIVSPYVRAVETFHGVASAWSDPDKECSHLTDPLERRKAWYGKLVEKGLSWAEDPRIREQDFGNLQNPALILKAKKERNQFGAFYYRFPDGESAADVFDRTSTFLDSLWRTFDVHPSRNFVLVTHGISIRVLLARYFRYTVDQFHLLSNPRNCEMIVLTHNGHGRLQMAGRHELETINVHPSIKNKDGIVMRYKFKKRLRVLPPEHVHKVKIRICQSEQNENEDQE
ncbi:hypothetical protein ACA910_000760 [Epithemia clementina (nom. ined.)]